MTAEPGQYHLSHLRYLEAESIHILREVAAEFERPVLLYSIGKDSSVCCGWRRRPSRPAKIPFPLLHVDTGYKFPEMYAFRDRCAREIGVDAARLRNEAAIAAGANPFDLGTQRCCGFLKTEALLTGLRHHGFDAAIGGRAARRGEVAGQGAVFSFRDAVRPVGPQEPAARAVEPLQRPHRAGRDHPRLPAVELDRARRLAVHLPREDPGRPAVLRPRARRGRARRPAHRARRVLRAGRPATGRQPASASSACRCRFRSLGCVPCCRRDPLDGRHRRGDHRGDDGRADLRARHARHRPRRGRLDGTKKREGYF